MLNVSVSLTALSDDVGVFPQHGSSGFRECDDDFQSQLTLHVCEVGVRTQLLKEKKNQHSAFLKGIEAVSSEHLLVKTCFCNRAMEGA